MLLNSKTPDGRHEFKILPHKVAEIRDSKRRIAKTLGLHDFNDDGLLDLHLGTMGKGTERTAWKPTKAGLMRSGDYCTQINQGDGTFVYQNIGGDGIGNKRAIVFADFDGDSRFDAYINTSPYYGPWYSGSPAPPQLYPGIGSDGEFGPNIIGQILTNAPEHFWSDKNGNGKINFKGAVARDFDNDGKPDLISGAMADIRGDSFSNMVTPGDGPAYQGDWYRGIFVFRNTSQPNQIRFKDVSNTAITNAYGKTDQMHVKTIIPADINTDGYLDLLVAGPRGDIFHGTNQNSTDTVRAYLNRSSPGKISFEDITQQAGLGILNNPNHADVLPHLVGIDNKTRFSHIPGRTNIISIDLDNDADQDIVLLRYGSGTKEEANIDTHSNLPKAHSWIFLNDGTAKFTPVGPAHTGFLTGAKHMITGDFNADGLIDIVATKPDHTVSPNGGNHIYFNAHKNHNNYVKINVLGDINKLGIGAKVTIFESGTERILGYDEVRTDIGYRSKRSTTLHFGLGEATTIDVLLRARNGRSIVHRNLMVNTKHDLKLP